RLLGLTHCRTGRKKDSTKPLPRAVSTSSAPAGRTGYCTVAGGPTGAAAPIPHHTPEFPHDGAQPDVAASYPRRTAPAGSHRVLGSLGSADRGPQGPTAPVRV